MDTAIRPCSNDKASALALRSNLRKDRGESRLKGLDSTSTLNRLNRRFERLLQRRAPFQLLDLPERIAIALQTPIARDAIGG